MRDERTDRAMTELLAAISSIIGRERGLCRICGLKHKMGQLPNEGHDHGCPYRRLVRVAEELGNAIDEDDSRH